MSTLTPAAPPVPAQPDTRRRILDLAERLLQARGFHAFSYQHIARELGVKPAAIHYHYASKEDLGAAIIGRQRGRLRKWSQLPEVASLSPAARFRALLAVYEWYLRQDARLCVFGALVAEFNTVPVSMQQELRAFNLELTAWLAAVLTEGRANGELHFVGDPAAKAAQVITSLMGGLQLARVHGPESFRLIVGQLHAELFPPAAP